MMSTDRGHLNFASDSSQKAISSSRRRMPGLSRDDRLHLLAPRVVGHPDDGDLHDRRVLGEDPLHLRGVDVLAPLMIMS